MLKVADCCPAGTNTLAATTATDALLESQTVVPPAGAFPDRVTVPVTVLPETALDTESVRVLSDGVTMVSVAVLLTPPVDPVIITDIMLATGLVVIPNVALLAPAGMVTDAGT